MNKIKILTPKISLINNIGTPSNSPRHYKLEIADSGANIHISNEATPTMDPVIIPTNITLRLIDGNTMELSHAMTLQIPGITKKTRQIHIFPKIRTVSLI